MFRFIIFLVTNRTLHYSILGDNLYICFFILEKIVNSLFRKKYKYMRYN